MELDDNFRKFIQIGLWIAEAVYVLWLFLLPYAPVRFHFYEILIFFFFFFRKFLWSLYKAEFLSFYLIIYLFIMFAL